MSRWLEAQHPSVDRRVPFDARPVDLIERARRVTAPRGRRPDSYMQSAVGLLISFYSFHYTDDINLCR